MNFQPSGNLFFLEGFKSPTRQTALTTARKARTRLRGLRKMRFRRHSDPALWAKNPSWFKAKGKEGFFAQNRRSE
jgi:hypothetical protein